MSYCPVSRCSRSSTQHQPCLVALYLWESNVIVYYWRTSAGKLHRPLCENVLISSAEVVLRLTNLPVLAFGCLTCLLFDFQMLCCEVLLEHVGSPFIGIDKQPPSSNSSFQLSYMPYLVLYAEHCASTQVPQQLTPQSVLIPSQGSTRPKLDANFCAVIFIILLIQGSFVPK